VHEYIEGTTLKQAQKQHEFGTGEMRDERKALEQPFDNGCRCRFHFGWRIARVIAPSRTCDGAYGK